MRSNILNLLLAAAALFAAPAPAQNLTPAQKEADFRHLASLYSTYYAPLVWKAQAVGFNASDVRPWLERVSRTNTDLEFYEICVEYIAGLKDTHVSFVMPSDFSARLGFGVDIYDGLLLIDTLDRSLLPASRYPFGIGDEVVSIDEEDAQAVVDRLMKYVPQGNPRASRRQAAQRLTSRAQSRIPNAAGLSGSATVVIRRMNGDLETYTMPWVKTGTPMEAGPVPGLRSASSRSRSQAAAPPDPLEELQFSGVTDSDTLTAVNGYGARSPIFLAGMGPTFTRRLGSASSDFFFSGVFQRDGLRIGYIRIPSYSPPSQAVALAQFDAEITYMNANTDGLVVDQMRNPGGSLCFGETLAARLTPYEFRVTGFDLRAYWGRVLRFHIAMINAKSTNAPWETVAQYEMLFNELLAANREGRTVTRTLPLCGSSLTRAPLRDAAGNIFAYQKPILVLIDDFSTSTADSFAAMMQDSGRAVLYGMRSNGAGGNNTSVEAGAYTEAYVGMTVALQVRKDPVESGEYPASTYIENVGVRPQIVNDYMTRENLTGSGARFVDQFLQAMAAMLR
ncbi:MAG: PDZ domain-containing protein [Acidobacteria bacterium]|nr:PDZ domain-containing protein [Acidobacteriota bacterium]